MQDVISDHSLQEEEITRDFQSRRSLFLKPHLVLFFSVHVHILFYITFVVG